MKLEQVAPGVLPPLQTDTSGSPAEAFSALAERVVDYLTERTPISSWSVNRVDHDVQVHLHVGGDLISRGQEVPWDESICRRVIEDGLGPVVPDLRQDSALKDTQWADQVGSYAGRPIIDSDGELFGMICGVDVDTLGPDDEVDLELLDLFCSLLSAQATLARQATTRAEQDVTDNATTDLRTGLLSRAAWDELLVGALTRSRAFGDLGAVIALEVRTAQGPLSSTRLHEAASATSDAAGADESLTYLGDGVFASLLDDATPSSLAGAVRAHRETLQARGFEAAIGWSLLSPADDSAAVVLQRAKASIDEERRAADDDSLSG